MPSVVLITGANRGLGRGLTELYLSQPGTTVLAAVRDPQTATSQSLLNVPVATGSSIVILKMDTSRQTDPEDAMRELEDKYAINHIDTVIANAGISQILPTVAQLDVEDLRRHMEVNVFGNVWLFQAVLPFLEESAKPKWVTMSSGAGSIGLIDQFVHPNAAYGATKAVLNFHTRKVHCEHPNLCSFAMDPGFVSTDMGKAGAAKLGFQGNLTTPEESCSGMKKIIDTASRESHGGKFVRYSGDEVPW